MAYTRPFFTRDVDIGVATEPDQESWRVFNRPANFGRVDGHSVVICDTPVEVFPIEVSYIIEDALANANRKRVEGVVVKVAPPEHLLLESLRVYRSQNKGRVFLLDEVVDNKKLRVVLRGLGQDGVLKARYQELTSKAP